MSLEDWSLLEAFQRPIKVDAQAAGQAALMPIYGESEDLNSGGVSRSAESGRIRLSDISVASDHPALLRASRNLVVAEALGKSANETLDYQFDGMKSRLTLPASFPEFMLHAKRLFCVQESGRVLLLKRDAPQGEFSAERSQVFGTFSMKPDPEWVEAELGLKPSSGLGTGRVLAIHWALIKAVAEGGAAIVGGEGIVQILEPVVDNHERAALERSASAERALARW